MNLLEQIATAALLLIVLPACSQAEDSTSAFTSQSATESAQSVAAAPGSVIELPEESAVIGLVGSAVLDFPGDGSDAPVAVADRILDGFQAGPGRLRFNDGSVIHWGFKHEEANLQSIAVRDAQGRLRLLGAVSNLGRLTSNRARPLVTLGQYQQYRRAAMLEDASVTLFVADAADLDLYFPVVKRWLQADLMGFNADCSDAKLTMTCELSAKIEPGVVAYVSNGDSAVLTQAPVPNVPAAAVPMKHFKN